MQVFLDDLEVGCSGNTPLHALHAARVAAQHAQRIIIEVRVDGEDWDGDPDAVVAGRPASVVAFRSTPAKALVRSAWGDLSQVADHIVQSQNKAAVCLQTGDVPGAMEHVDEAIEGWQMIERGLREGAALLNLEPEETLSTAGEPELLAGLSGELRKVQQAISEQNWPDLSDHLVDEMGQLAGRWKTTLGVLGEKLSG